MRILAVKMYDKNTGELLGTYNSVKEAAKKTGINKSTINANLYERTRAVYKKYYFTRVCRDTTPVIREPVGGRGKSVDMYDYNTKEYIKTYPSISAAAFDIGSRASNISANLMGNTKSVKNKRYYFKYHYD